MRRLAAALALTLALLAAAAPLPAQTVKGVLLESGTSRPIVAAQITLLTQSNRREAAIATDTAGQFEIEARAYGRFRLKAERLGYQTLVSDTFHLGASELVEVRLQLAADAIALEPLTVTARSRPPSRYLAQAGFYDRKKGGVGSFITREEIANRRPNQLSDVLRMVPGLRFDPAGTGRRNSTVSSRSTGRCQPVLVLDGVLTAVGGELGRSRWSIPMDDAVNVHDIEGIEVYRGSSEIPTQFNIHTGDCGVLVIWTRRR